MDAQREEGSRQDERQREEEVECEVIVERLPKRRRNGNIA